MKKLNTNSNEVRKAVQEHIKNYYEDVNDLKAEVENLKGYNNIFTDYQAGAYMVQSGCFLYYHADVKDFLNGLSINPDNKEYSNEKSWELYKYLIALNCERLVNNKGVK